VTIISTRPEESRSRRHAFIPGLACRAFLPVLLVWCVAAGFQDGPVPDEADDRIADRAPTDVYLNDSFDARDAIAQAKRFCDLGRWSQAATILQDASDRFGDRLVRVADGRYVGLRRHISMLIARWPGRGMDAYRRLYDRAAGKAFESARARREIEELLIAFEAYFCTSAAAAEADLIAQRAIEAGNLALAQRVYRAVIDDHPDGRRYATAYRAKLSILASMRQDAARAAELAEQVLAGDPTATVWWKDTDRPLAELNEEILREFAEVGRSADAEVWPTFGGHVSRNRAIACAVDEPGLLWRVPGLAGRGDESPGEPEDDYTARIRDSERARLLSVNPIITTDLVIAQHGGSVLAIHRLCGTVAWRFDEVPAVSSRYDELDGAAPGWDCPTFHDGRVYVSISGEPPPSYSFASSRASCALVCLEAATGKLLWRTDGGNAGEALEEITFDSSPIVANGRVFLVGRRRRSFGFEDCYLYRFRACDGVYERRTHLGSASTGSFGYHRATTTIPSLSGDLVFVCTNLGSIAAVCADDGSVRWLRLYRRAEDASQLRRGTIRETRPWHYNAVICDGDRLVCLPIDGKDVLVMNQADGSVLDRIPTEQIGRAETMLGVRNGVLYTVGDEVVAYDLAEVGQDERSETCRDLADVGQDERSETCRDLADSKKVWSATLPPGLPVYGRGVLVEDRLLLPTRGGLSAYRIDDGRRSDAPWDARGRGGNLVATPKMLLVAGDATIRAYVRKQTIWDGLRAKMAAAPDDPAPALDFAETALRDGDQHEALTALNEAARRAEADDQPIDATIRRRMFDDSLVVAEALVGRRPVDGDDLDRLFEHAQRWAPDALAHLTYRLRFAEWFERFDQPKRAVRLYQQILLDRSLRRLPTPGPAESRVDASEHARKRISGLIDQHGPPVYSVFEESAQRLLQAGRAAADRQTLIRVVETYPNSNAAPQAIITRGDLLVAKGEAENAAKLFRLAYYGYLDQIDRPELIRKIADAYEQSGRVADAYLWLAKAAREYPTALIEVNGRKQTFHQYGLRLAHVRDAVEPSRPSIDLPLEHAYVKTFDEGVALLPPRFSHAPSADWSRFYVYAGGGVKAFEPSTGTPLWPAPAPVHAAPELLIATDEIALFATRYQLIGLDADTGTIRWKEGTPPPELDDENRDWEGLPVFVAHEMHGDFLVSVREGGPVQCVNVSGGDVRFRSTPDPPPAERIAISKDWIVYEATRNGRATVEVLNAADGKPARTITVDEQDRIERLLVTIDGQVLLITAQSIIAYDLDTARRRWAISPGGRIRNAAVLLDIDGLYLSSDGRHVAKYGLGDGSRSWQSGRLTERGDFTMTFVLQNSNLIVSTQRSVQALDRVSGQILWRGTTPDRPQFTYHMPTRSYFLVLDIPPAADGRTPTLFCYDHRNASGLLPRDGGVLTLAGLDDVIQVLATDGALVVQSGDSIHVWRRNGRGYKP